MSGAVSKSREKRLEVQWKNATEALSPGLLLEIVKKLNDSMEPNKECPHGEEVWYCDSCKLEWEKRVNTARIIAKKILDTAGEDASHPKK